MVALVELAYRGEGSRDGWTSEADLIEGQRTDAAMVAEALDRPGAHILLAYTRDEADDDDRQAADDDRDGEDPGDAHGVGGDSDSDSGERGKLIGCCELQRPRRNAKLVPAGEVGAEDETSQPLHEERKADDPPAEAKPDAVSDGAAYLGMFSVDPTLQGGGVGKQFLEEAERIARTEWDADAIELTVIDLRTELIDWYARRGYEHTGRFKDFPYGDERFGIPARDDLRLAVLAKPLR